MPDRLRRGRVDRLLGRLGLVIGVLAGGVGSAVGAPATNLHAHEQLLLYPAVARRVGTNFEIEVHGLVYEPERRRLLAAMLRKIVGLDDDKMTSDEKVLFRERSGYFFVDDERGKSFAVVLGGSRFVLGTSAANGHFVSHWRWPTNADVLAPLLRSASNACVNVPLGLEGNARVRLPMELHFLSETGWSIISDIDDTIKVSHVRDRSALLRNTFSQPFQSVPGMAEVYRGWEQADGAQFHYVTASPWQLYQPLAEFARSNGFPAGTFHMKEWRLKDGTAFSVFGSPAHYKPRVIEPLLREFPERQFVLVGDSGEKDPEIYGELARKYPRQIRRICIRDVTGEEATAARYRAAFAQVPRERWLVFSNAAQIKDALTR